MSGMIHEPGRIAVFIGNHRYQCQDIADAAFRSYVRENAPQLVIEESRPTHEIPEQAYWMVKNLLETKKDLVGILIVGGGISGVLRALREVPAERRDKIKVICRDIGPATLGGLGEGLVTATLCHPVDAMPDLLVDTLIEVINKDTIDSPIQKTLPFDILTPANF